MKLDPKKIQKMMSQLGISQDEIPANRVIIEQEDKRIIINEPSVTKVNMQGQDQFQISGDISEEELEEEGISEEDIQQVVGKTGKTEEEAKKALEQADGDLAEAILSLS
tara:strand:+ start:1160 stop:1486 length:327 start_codon:yes stop_codon:yes gene_type:complete